MADSTTVAAVIGVLLVLACASVYRQLVTTVSHDEIAGDSDFLSQELTIFVF